METATRKTRRFRLLFPPTRVKRSRHVLYQAVTFISALAALAISQPATDLYVFTSFDPPGSITTFPVGINNNGVITLQYFDVDGNAHSATLKDGVYTTIDVPGSAGTLVSAPNMEGQVALGYVNPDDGTLHAALYTRGSYAFLLDVPGEQNTSPSAMNAQGQISGVTWTGDFYVVHGYIWDGTDYTIFDHPNTDIPSTAANGINNRGQIAGYYTMLDGAIHAFVKEGDAYTEISFPGAPNTAAFSINNSGEIVGLYGEAGPGPFGFAVGSQGFILSKGRFATLSYPGAESSFPLSLNDTGQIVGVYLDDQGAFHGYLATLVHKR